MFGRKKVGENASDNSREKNQWEQMAIDANHMKTYNELLGLDPTRLSEEERFRVVSFALEMIDESFGKSISRERLERVLTNVRILNHKEYDEEIDKLPDKEIAKFMLRFADGFYSSQTDSVFIQITEHKRNDTAPEIMENLIRNVIHESLHFVCERETELQSRGLNEGITELYTNRIMARVGAECGCEFYAEEQEFAGVIESIVSPESLEEAYFDGDFSKIAGRFKKGEFELLLAEADEYFKLLGVIGMDKEREEKRERLYSRINRYKNNRISHK